MVWCGSGWGWRVDGEGLGGHVCVPEHSFVMDRGHK